MKVIVDYNSSQNSYIPGDKESTDQLLSLARSRSIERQEYLFVSAERLSSTPWVDCARRE